MKGFGFLSIGAIVGLKKRAKHIKDNFCSRDKVASLFPERLEDRLVLSATTASLAFDGAVGNELFSHTRGEDAKFGYDLAWFGSQLAAPELSISGPQDPASYSFDLSSLFTVRDGKLAIQAVSEGDVAALTSDLAAIGMTIEATYEHTVTGYLSSSDVSELTTLDSLAFASAIPAPITNVGISESQGNVSQRTDVLQAFAGVDGSGLSVGILSNSFDYATTDPSFTVATDLAADILSGDLPGSGNPLGNLTPVNVVDEITISEAASLSNSNVDEGRAMAQIIHDIAPGAELLFASGFGGKQAFADNIVNLANAGADIIVDDLIYLTEPMFQDGVVAQAVDQVVNAGVTYFSSAGNNAEDSYESIYSNSGQTLTINLGGGQSIVDTLHDFDASVGVDTWQQLTLPPGVTSFALQWDDPFKSVSQSSTGATRDYNIWLRDPINPIVLLESSFISTLGGDPVEWFSYENSTPGNQVLEVAIGFNGSSPGVNDAGRLKYVMFSPGSLGSVDEYGTDSSTSYGHANTEGSISVGAAFFDNTPEFGATQPLLEGFSSLGGTDILFDTSGNRLAQPETREGVDVVGPDGVNTTFFGSDISVDTDSDPNFFGTSASAPHVAGLAALLLQADPTLTPDGIETLLEQTAIDMDNPYTVGFDVGFDDASGHGFVDALGAIGVLLDIPEAVGLEPDEYIVVNDTRDLLDTNPDPNIVDIDALMPGEQVSLRSAIIEANSVGSNLGLILLSPGVHQLTRTGTESGIDAALNDLDITSDVSIIGAGAGLSVIDASTFSTQNSQTRVFEIHGGGKLDFSRATVTGGHTVGLNAAGAGFLVSDGASPGELLLTDAAVLGNTAADSAGGGVFRNANATATILRSVIAGNHAESGGGGIRSNGVAGALTIGETVIANNTAGSGVTQKDVSFGPNTTKVNLGNNLITEASGDDGLFSEALGDVIGSAVAPIVVTTARDESEATSEIWDVSLREAVNQASTTDGTVWLPAWRHRLTLTGGTDTTEVNDLDINGDVTLIGAGAGLSIIDASGFSDVNANTRAIGINPGHTLNLERVTVTGGEVFNTGGVAGGGLLINSGATLNASHTAFVDNQAEGRGGAIRVSDGTANIAYSVFTGNISGSNGGAVSSIEAGGAVHLVGNVFANNTAANNPNLELTNGSFSNGGYNLTDDTSGTPTDFFSTGLSDVIGAAAAPIVVTTVRDENDPNNGLESVSLRDAIIAANASNGTVWLPAWRHELTIDGSGENLAATGDLDITGNVTVVGAGAGLSVIDAGGQDGLGDRVFDVRPSASLDFSRGTVTGGYLAQDPGAGFLVNNVGSLTLSESAVVNNTAAADGGGGLARLSNGDATIEQSVFVGNHAATHGGALRDFSTSGTLSAESTVFAGNTAGLNTNTIFSSNGAAPINLGNNLVDDNANDDGFFDTSLGDLIGAASTPIVVTTVRDENEATSEVWDISLREAVIDANATNGTVWLPAWRHGLSVAGTEVGLVATVNDLDITGDVDVVGVGAGLSVIDTSSLAGTAPVGQNRAFHLSGASSSVDLSRLTITGGGSSTGENGTAIAVDSSARAGLSEVAIVSNVGSGGGGAAVRSTGGHVEVMRSVFSGNTNGGDSGGAIHISPNGATHLGSLTVGESVFAGNSAVNHPNVWAQGMLPENLTNLGNNLVDNTSGNFFNALPGVNDLVGTPTHVVTSVADRLEDGDDAYALSLREAIQQIGSGTGTVWLPAWRHGLSISDVETSADLLVNDLDISGNVTLVGASMDSTIIDASTLGGGETHDRAFEVHSGSSNGDLTASRLTITGGNTSASGGGVFATINGELTLDKVRVAGNEAQNNGGGVYVAGTATITNSVIENNKAEGNAFSQGGGLFTEGSSFLDFTIGDSAIAGNTATVEGANQWGFSSDPGGISSLGGNVFDVFGTATMPNGNPLPGGIRSQLDPTDGPLGDYNRDGIVDAGDYTVWRDSFNDAVVPYSAADGDGDGLITANDYSIWNNSYNSTLSTGAPNFATFLARTPGDYNDDGMVDFLDYLEWETNLGSTTNLAADGNRNGVIDFSDLGVWQSFYGATTYDVIPGDFNDDDMVDAADYTVWQDTLGSTTDLRADASGNGVVDQADYDIWEAHYGLVSAEIYPLIINPIVDPMAALGAPTIETIAIGNALPTSQDFASLVGSGEQLRSLPFLDANSVSIVFSEQTLVQRSDLLLTNLDGSSPSTATGFTYDMMTNTATWTFGTPFDDGRYLLTLSDDATDVSGDALDGEFLGAWSLSDTGTAIFPTGDGDAGGDFRFHFTVLENDTDRDNIDGATDYTNWTSTEPGAIYVSTTVDENDGDLSFGDVSLREAVIHANAQSGPTLIVVPDGHYYLDVVGSESNSATDATVNDLDITGDVTVAGYGPGRTIVDTTNLSISASPDNFRAFDIEGTGNRVRLSGLTMTGSYSIKAGMGLRVEDGAVAEVVDSVVVSNLSYWGGTALRSRGGDLTVLRSVFTNNNVAQAGSSGAIAVSNQNGYTGNVTIGDSIFALNNPGPGATGGTNVVLGTGATGVNLGNNLYDDAAGGFFDVYTGVGDHLGTPDYVVTSVADTFDHSDGVESLSLREAVDLANQSGGASEIWLPAWNFTLTRDRQTYGGGSATDMDVAFGDLDISDDLVIRGVKDETTVAWKAGVVDEVFDLLGDYNNDGDADFNNVSSADYTVWQNEDGSGSGTSADWEVYAADGDDDGDVDQDDYDVWNDHFGNTLDLFDVG